MNDANGPEKLEEKLRASEKRYSELLETMLEGFATHELICDSAGNPSDYRFLEVNSGFERLTGLKREEVVGRTVLEVMPKTEKSWVERYGRVVQSGEPLRMEEYSGVLEKWYEVNAFRTAPGRFAVSFFDITERKTMELELEETQRELLKSVRLYRMLTQINQTAARVKDLKTLYCSLCEAVVNDGGFRMAWMGLPDTDTGRLNPVCSAGETGDYLESIRIPFDDQDNPRGKGPSGSAAKKGTISVCLDIETDPRMEPWRVKALAHGYASSAAVPLSSNGRVIAVLNIYSSEKNWFLEEELKLLAAVRADCELAIDAIASEEKRAAAENALKRTTDHLMHVMESVPAVIMQLSRRGDALVPDWISGSFLEITGYSSEEMFAPDWFRKATFPEELTAVISDAMGAFEKGSTSHDFRLKRKDGRVIWVHAQMRAASKDGNELIGSWTDITHLKDTPRPGDRNDG